MWRSDDNIDMRDHIQRRTLPAGADREALGRLISELHSERLDRSRPMWIAYLIDGLEDARFACISRCTTPWSTASPDSR